MQISESSSCLRFGVDFHVCVRRTVVLFAMLKDIFLNKVEVDLTIHYQVLMLLMRICYFIFTTDE